MSRREGNMYDWVTDTWTPLAGECPHRCSYCYVRDMKRFPAVQKKYSGQLRMEPDEKWPKLGRGKRWFVGHMTDLWARSVDRDDLRRVLMHCCKWQQNEYVFQTKYPQGYWDQIEFMPARSIRGVTVESDLWHKEMGESQGPHLRLLSFVNLRRSFPDASLFLTIEPVMRFSKDFVHWIRLARPSWVNIGADSKGKGLPEPEPAAVVELMSDLAAYRIEVRLKPNLMRLVGRELFGKIGGEALPVVRGDGV